MSSKFRPGWEGSIRLALLTAALLASAAVLAACGSSDSTSSSSTGGESAAETVSSEENSAEGQVSGAEGNTGVTAKSIKIGFIVENYPRDNSVPFFFREDAQEAVEALVGKINDEGGLVGRQIEPVFTDITPGFDPKPAREACLTLTKQDHVFAVIGGYATPAGDECFINENHTPLIDMAALSEAANEAFKGYHMSPSPNYTRVAKDWVYGGKEAGEFEASNGFEKLGIVDESCEAEVWTNPETGVLAWLESIGVGSDEISEFTTDCTEESLLTNHEPALLKMTQEGVSTMMIASQPLDRNFTALAKKSGFEPQYLWGDLHWATQAANAQSLNQEAIDGSVGVTAFRQDVDAPAAKECSKTLEEAGLPGFTQIQSDLLVMNFCTELNILRAVSEKAGKNLTQQSFVDAAPETGEIPSAVELKVDFDGTTTGGQEYQIVKWDSGNTEWVPQGKPKPSTYTPGETAKAAEG